MGVEVRCWSGLEAWGKEDGVQEGVRLVGVGIIGKKKSLKMMLYCVAVTKTPQEWDKRQC